MSPEERARRIKWGIPDDPAKRAPTPEQRAAIDRLTGNAPGGSARTDRAYATPPGRPRVTPPPDRVRPPAAPQPAPVRERPAADRPVTERSIADRRAADPAAKHAAAARPAAERPRDRPVANDPAPDRAVANRPVTDRPAGDRPEDGHAADTPSGRDTRDGPDDSGDVQAKIADLQKQLADSKSELQAERTRNADLETQLAAEKARNVDLTNQVTDRDARLDAANTRLDEQDAKITEQATGLSALTETVEKQGDVIQSVLQRMQRTDNAGADRPALDTDVRGAPQPEVLAAPDAAGDSEDEKLDGRYIEDDAQLADRQKPSWYQRGPVDSTLTLASTGLGTGLTGLSHFMTSELGWGATFAGGIVSFAFAGVSWIRDRRKRRNAD